MSYLGSICTTPMCTAGKASVDEMDATFQALGYPDGFRGQVESIDQTFAKEWDFYDPWIPFNPQCCTIRDIGVQADDVTARMQEAVGITPAGRGPATGSPPGELPTFEFGLGLGVVALVFFGLAYASKK